MIDCCLVVSELGGKLWPKRKYLLLSVTIAVPITPSGRGSVMSVMLGTLLLKFA